MRRKLTVFRRELTEWLIEAVAPPVSAYVLLMGSEILVLQTLDKVL